jgi:hypothetical protein
LISKDHQILLNALRDLRVEAGAPSLRAIAEGAGTSHTSVDGILKGDWLPRWDALAAIIRSLDGNELLFHQLWSAAWLGKPVSNVRQARNEVSVRLAGDLDELLSAVAGADAVTRELVTHCKRCRNSLLYLMRPGGGSVTTQVRVRLKALPINHEAHHEAHHFDDAVPRFTS